MAIITLLVTHRLIQPHPHVPQQIHLQGGHHIHRVGRGACRVMEERSDVTNEAEERSDVTREAENKTLGNSVGSGDEDAITPEPGSPLGSHLCPDREDTTHENPTTAGREDHGDDGAGAYTPSPRPLGNDGHDDIISDEITGSDSHGGQLLGSAYDYSDNSGGSLCGPGGDGGQTGHQKGQRSAKSFICSECGMFFNRHANLTRHQRVHTGERPFLCTECNKSYTQRADLTRHQKSHTAVKTYPCRDCGYRFAHKAQLEIHRKAHRGRTQYACAVCGKCFIKYPNLLAHQQVHLQPKPEPTFFRCSLCEEKFIHKSDLAKHERLHTGEKFLCLECGIRFSCSSSLHRHQKIHGEGTTAERRGDPPPQPSHR